MGRKQLLTGTHFTTPQDTSNTQYPLMGKHGPYRVDILQALAELFNCCNDNFNRTLIVRLDLTTPNSYHKNMNNKAIKYFVKELSAYFKKLEIKYKFHPQYLWVREQCPDTDRIHYHLVITGNYDAIRSFYSHVVYAQELWRMALGLEPGNWGNLVHVAGETLQGVLLKRGDQEQFAKIFHWLSYLAKDKTKTSDGNRSWGRSQCYTSQA